jgi:hypothetical protein
MRALEILLALPLLVPGCGGDGGAAIDARPTPDAAITDGPIGPDAACFDNPTTHNEIVNACTTAQKIYKDSHPPLLDPDGTLPPLPP